MGGACGSCWSFSATGCMEGAYFKATGELLQFSEQELVSCDIGGEDNGCGGGGPDTAFDWVIRSGGISTEQSYPYDSGGGKAPTCDSSKQQKVNQFTSFNYVPSRQDEMKLLAALQHEGP